MIDSLDLQIIRILQEDARQSSEKLAKELNVHPTTVRRRIGQLIDRKVLRIGALIDPIKVGLPVAAVLALNVAPDKIKSAVEVLGSWPEVKWISTTTGRFDVLVLVRFASNNELSSFLQNQLAFLEGIKDTETFVVLDVTKGLYTRLI